jgi:membrane protease YdiL (CAAX protease family)
MAIITAFIKRYPLLSYFALTFAISWGVVLIAVGLGPGGFSATPQQLQMAVPYAVPAMVLGPGVAGILLTGLIYGRAGLREFRSRLLRWRVGARWYAVAILTASLLITAVLLGLSLLPPECFARIFITSDKASVLLMSMAVGLAAGIFEELSWTGFAVPTMRLRYGVLGTGLIVGVLWQTWHLLIDYWSSGVTSGEISLAIWLPAWLIGTVVGQLVAYRVLMVWVYERTESLLLAMLMHTSLAGFTFILFPPSAVVANLISGFAYAAALWVVVAAVAMANGWHLTRQPLLRRVTGESGS